jgi:hypothetical protein
MHLVDQAVPYSVDGGGVDLREHPGKDESGDVFVVDDDVPDLDAIANLRPQSRALVEKLTVPCPDLVMARRNPSTSRRL